MKLRNYITFRSDKKSLCNTLRLLLCWNLIRFLSHFGIRKLLSEPLSIKVSVDVMGMYICYHQHENIYRLGASKPYAQRELLFKKKK